MAAPDPSRRVAVVLHEPLLGGATTSLLRMLDGLERRGWSFTFWVPVVASRVGGVPEEVGDDGGPLVESEDVDGFAGRRRVERLFTLERQAEGIDAAYRAALRVAS